MAAVRRETVVARRTEDVGTNDARNADPIASANATTSRPFAVVGVAESIAEAEAVAEDALDAAGEGARIRHDIGKSDLVQRRIGHVAELRGE